MAVRATPYRPKKKKLRGTTGNGSDGSGVTATYANGGTSNNISSIEVRIPRLIAKMNAPKPRNQMYPNYAQASMIMIPKKKKLKKNT